MGTDGRADAQKHRLETGGRADNRTSGRPDGRTGGWTGKQADWRTDGRVDGRTGEQADRCSVEGMRSILWDTDLQSDLK